MNKEYLTVALKAAKETAELLRENNSDLDIKTKTAPHDIVTELDLRAEKLIRSIISESYPSHSIFGEEFGMDLKNSEYVWIIDPIDGTSSFAKSKTGYGISIALSYKGKIIVGVVFDPAKDERYYAINGEGAFKNDMPISAKNKEEILLLRNNAEPYRTKINEIIKDTKLKSEYGSSTALALAHVAEGRFVAAIKLTYNPWDIAAGYIIAKEAGVIITDFNKQELKFDSPEERNKYGIIAVEQSAFSNIFLKLSSARKKILHDI